MATESLQLETPSWWDVFKLSFTIMINKMKNEKENNYDIWRKNRQRKSENGIDDERIFVYIKYMSIS